MAEWNATPWARDLPAQAQQTLSLRTRPDRPARSANLSIAWGRARILPPQNDPASKGQTPLMVWVLRAWEVAAPAGQEPLEWLLLSTLPVENEQQASERITWYRHRWLIAQFHKALKTGCRMEDSQLQQGEALTRLLGWLSIVAVRLLQVEVPPAHDRNCLPIGWWMHRCSNFCVNYAISTQPA